MVVHPRVAFALLLATVCAIAAVVGVTLAARDDGSDGGNATAGLQIVNGWAGAERSPDIPPGRFDLRDQDGKRISLAAFRGRPVVLTFAYSTCEDTCPAMVQAIRQALDEIGRDVPALAISVDPANDTPARAKRFLVAQHMTGRMDFLLGSRAELAPVWREYAMQPQTTDFEHNAYVLLIDAQGRQRVAHPADKLTTAGLAHDLRRLLATPPRA